MLSLNWLPETAYLFILVFARVGTMLMLLPALGEQTIPARMRLSFALAVTLVLYPLISATIPALPADFSGVVPLLFHEVVVGLVLGGIARLVMMATQVAGSVIAFQTGLSIAQTADPSQEGVQGAIIGNFLGVLGTTLIFATNLHHVALAAIHDSYRVFSPTAPLMFDDALRMALDVTASAFVIGVQMSAPFIVFGLVFNLGLGILARLMPQLQVFFIAMPASIVVGLVLFALLLVMMMGSYISYVDAQFVTLRGT